MTTSQWNLDTTHSSITFSIRHMVVSKIRGRFNRFAGSIMFDAEDPTGATVEMSIEVASIDTGTAERDAHLRSADFFDEPRFPSIRFHSTRIEVVANLLYRVFGELTMHGVTREVTLDVEYVLLNKDPWGGERVAITGTTAIDRSDFDLRWNKALDAGGVLVGDRIEVEVDVQAVKAAAVDAA